LIRTFDSLLILSYIDIELADDEARQVVLGHSKMCIIPKD